MRVNLTKRVEIKGAGLRYCPAVISSNGKVKTDFVMVDGEEQRHGEGTYYIEWREDGQRKRRAVGSDAQEAQNARKLQELKLEAAAHGRKLEGGPTNEQSAPDARRTLEAALHSTDAEQPGYLTEIKAHKSKKTHAAYSTALGYFQKCCTKTFVDEVGRTDLLKLKTYLKSLKDEKQQSDRSVWNKFSIVMGFLKWAGRSGKVMGVGKYDWPEYDEETPETYTEKELTKLFAACTPEETQWFRFFEYTGMREGEVQHCQWSWIDMKNRTVTVQPNKRFNWKPKKNKTRSIPISNPLFQLLTELQKGRDNTCDLVFATSGCKIKMDFLDCLKRAAKRAGLPEEGFWLHKFRATFATNVVRKADIRTVMEWLGHSDTDSTMRYLRPAEGQAAQDKINAVFS
jgi:integrase/recombinase XerD